MNILPVDRSRFKDLQSLYEALYKVYFTELTKDTSWYTQFILSKSTIFFDFDPIRVVIQATADGPFAGRDKSLLASIAYQNALRDALAAPSREVLPEVNGPLLSTPTPKALVGRPPKAKASNASPIL